MTECLTANGFIMKQLIVEQKFILCDKTQTLHFHYGDILQLCG
jgi:hypothetical protein